MEQLERLERHIGTAPMFFKGKSGTAGTASLSPNNFLNVERLERFFRLSVERLERQIMVFKRVKCCSSCSKKDDSVQNRGSTYMLFQLIQLFH